MSIPLIQKPDKDDINTSIIAIKRNIERINMLLGLSNSEEIDTSKFATKDELQQAVTDLQPVDEVAVDNMHSVTSNAVAEKIKTISDIVFDTEIVIGTYGGKPLYRYTLYDEGVNLAFDLQDIYTYKLQNRNVDKVKKIDGTITFPNINTIPLNCCWSTFFLDPSGIIHYYQKYTSSSQNSTVYVEIEYTKTTD